jgi:uncharacterized membrane protein
MTVAGMETTPASGLSVETNPEAVPVSPTREDPIARGASELIGGPPGRHAVLPDRRTRWTPLRILMILVIMSCGLGYAQKSTCRDTRNWSHEYQYTRMCYSDVVALYSQEGLSNGKVPYLDYPTEYPPLIGATMQFVATFAGLAPAQHPVYRTENGQRVVDHYSLDVRAARFYDLTALMFLVAACVAVAATALTAGRRRIWDAALFALAPALVLHLLTNWDIIAVAFAAGALLAWSRRAPALAGVLLGLGIATKLYPALFLIGLGVLCLRTGQVRAFVRTAVATVGTVLAILVPLWLVAGYFTADRKVHDGILSTFWSGGNWVGLLDGDAGGARNAVARFFDLNRERPADWDSVAFGLQWLASTHNTGWFGGLHIVVALFAGLGIAMAVGLLLRDRARISVPAVGAAFGGWLVIVVVTPPLLSAIRDHGISSAVLNTATAVALVAAVAAIGALCWFAPRRPRLPQVLFLLVVAFLITSKVFSPQYTLWLLPLYALARPRWRMFLVWQAAEAYVLFTRFMHFIYNDTNGGRGMNRGWFVGAVALRDVVLLVIAGLVVREILRPELDVVRAIGQDDPAGGVLDGAPDVRSGRRAAAPRPMALAGAGSGTSALFGSGFAVSFGAVGAAGGTETGSAEVADGRDADGVTHRDGVARAPAGVAVGETGPAPGADDGRAGAEPTGEPGALFRPRHPVHPADGDRAGPAG